VRVHLHLDKDQRDAQLDLSGESCTARLPPRRRRRAAERETWRAQYCARGLEQLAAQNAPLLDPMCALAPW